MKKCFIPLAISFLGNLWLLTVQASGNQQVYKSILFLIILISLFVALKNIWELLDKKRIKVLFGISLFALVFNTLVISLNFFT